MDDYEITYLLDASPYKPCDADSPSKWRECLEPQALPTPHYHRREYDDNGHLICTGDGKGASDEGTGLNWNPPMWALPTIARDFMNTVRLARVAPLVEWPL